MRVTLVFMISVLIPSLLLCFFALQTVNLEQRNQKILRRSRTETRVETLRRDLQARFLARTLDPVETALRDVPRARRGADRTIAILTELARSNPLLEDLFLLDREGRRLFPRPEPQQSGADRSPQTVTITTPAALFGGASAAGLVESADAGEWIQSSRDLFKRGRTTEAIARLQPLLDSVSRVVEVAAALELARFHFALDHPATAASLLESYREVPLELIGPFGNPLGAEVRIEYATLCRRQGSKDLAELAIENLIDALARHSLRLSPRRVDEIASRASLNLDIPDRRFSDILHRRREAEREMTDLDLVFGRDLQRILLEARRRGGSDEPEVGGLADGRRSSGLRPDFLKHRVGSRYQLVLFAPLRDSAGRFSGLAGFRVKLDPFVERSLIQDIQSRNQRDPDMRVVATNPLFPSEDASAWGDENREFVSRRLDEPLDHIQLRAFEKTMTEAVALAHSKARLHIWLIMMAMIGITLGVFVTVVTVRREKRAAELKTDFVANVTHELKTPLTSIRLFIETLQLDHVESEEERAECLSIMARETDRLTRLIDRLLQFSKLDRRQWKLKLTYEDPVRLIEEAVQLYKEQHGVADVDIKVEALQTPKVTVDREAMIEVLYNLIHNAVKYTPSKGREIRVTIAERRRDVAISVVDNGVGVPRRDRRRIFRKFERGQYAERAQIQGSGIGLTLARSICRGHGGDLSYAPNKPNGSRFVITLPK